MSTAALSSSSPRAALYTRLEGIRALHTRLEAYRYQYCIPDWKDGRRTKPVEQFSSYRRCSTYLSSSPKPSAAAGVRCPPSQLASTRTSLELTCGRPYRGQACVWPRPGACTAAVGRRRCQSGRRGPSRATDVDASLAAVTARAGPCRALASAGRNQGRRSPLRVRHQAHLLTLRGCRTLPESADAVPSQASADARL